MVKREIKRDEVIEKFRPARNVLEEAVIHVRKMPTVKRIAEATQRSSLMPVANV